MLVVLEAADRAEPALDRDRRLVRRPRLRRQAPRLGPHRLVRPQLLVEIVAEEGVDRGRPAGSTEARDDRAADVQIARKRAGYAGGERSSAAGVGRGA